MANFDIGDLGDYIRDQRRGAQISLRQLARLAGISNPYLSQIERGLRRPSAEILQQIAKGLRISAEALYIQAGILEDRPAQSDVPAAVLADPLLNERQKQVLLEIHASFRKENGAAGRTTTDRAESPADNAPRGFPGPANFFQPTGGTSPGTDPEAGAGTAADPGADTGPGSMSDAGGVPAPPVDPPTLLADDGAQESWAGVGIQAASDPALADGDVWAAATSVPAAEAPPSAPSGPGETAAAGPAPRTTAPQERGKPAKAAKRGAKPPAAGKSPAAGPAAEGPPERTTAPRRPRTKGGGGG